MEPGQRRCTYDPLVELMKRFENVRAAEADADPFAGLSIEERLKRHIVDGIRKNLERDLEEALETYEPLQIVNEILLDGMKTVGDLFGSGQMQLPFVLQSAEVMKAAVRYLEPRMERKEGSAKGSILLATVAGDVHDIGKNLVDIILSNNGYRVVNIGIKQPIENILRNADEHRVDAIGMSGLLVKSTLVMRENLIEMNERGKHHYPVILGGAALTRAYVEQDLRSIYRGRVFYAQDAFEGLRIMETLGATQAPEDAPRTSPRISSHRLPDVSPDLYRFDGVRSSVPKAEPPTPPFLGTKRRERFDIFEIYRYINPVALFRGQWQYRRQPGQSNAEFDAWLEENVRPLFEQLQRELAPVLQPKVVWGYFACQSDGNDLIVRKPSVGEVRFRFPRQSDGRRLCLADYFRSDREDYVAFQAVTMGPEISRYERSLFESGDYRKYLLVHGMGVEAAEALAEYWHLQIRREWGIDDQEPDSLKLLFSAKYRGARFSFGYPACPNLEDQRLLFELLEPERIGMELTEEWMLSPEQSTTALIAHHPQAKYFNVR
ncbi:MAG: B12-binding domain-containing protein [Fimbriimonadales bacterium]|nr:B12-binding domain-containing protein [Fimbriimonadales bacterium]